MADCRYKKRLQFYLDGWIDERGARDIEKHLKHCSECQVEMADLAELNNAALEMVDEAPDHEYWDSFTTRVRNRILSRNVEPVRVIRKAPWYLSLRLASVVVVVLSLSAVSIALLRMGQMSTSPILTMTPPTVSQSQTPGIEQSQASTPSEIATAMPEANITGQAAVSKTQVSLPAQSKTNIARPRVNRTADVVNANELALKDPVEFIRPKPQIYNAAAGPSFANQPIEAEYTGPELVDPSYRMKSSFVSQRIIAGLAQETPDKSGSVSYNLASDNLQPTQNPTGEEIQSTWGYLRVAADTSKTNENKKYLIELELMQTK